jgi:hypothetical protein
VKQEVIYHLLVPEEKELTVEDKFHIPMIVRAIKARNSFDVLPHVSRNFIEILIVVDYIMLCPTVISLLCEIHGVSNPQNKITSIVD